VVSNREAGSNHLCLPRDIGRSFLPIIGDDYRLKKVLFIAYYFPPIGGAGTQRSLKFVKFLPKYGWHPLVVTGLGETSAHDSPRDETFHDEVPKIVDVYRTSRVETGDNPHGLLQRLRDLLGMSTRFTRNWTSEATKTAARAYAEKGADLIYVSLSPFEGALAASSLAERFGLPWIADLRDPWALDEVQVHVSSLHRRLELLRMRRRLRSASTIIMNTPEATKRLLSAFPEFSRKRVVTITNGFDAGDFTCRGRPVPVERPFTILHAGYLHVGSGLHMRKHRSLYSALGRTVEGVDFLTRSHYFLLQALERWVASDSGLRSKVRLTLVGKLSEEDTTIVKASSVSDLVEFRGYQSHQETVKQMAEASVLFLPMHSLPPGQRATIVPGKTYEYMATGQPILAAVPEGDARDFVTKAGTGYVCAPDDVEGMVRILRDLYAAWAERREAVHWNKECVDLFERRRLTQCLACEFDLALNCRASGNPTAGLHSETR
jgi:glycosyltransferase involved in cell wall biosynthesis